MRGPPDLHLAASAQVNVKSEEGLRYYLLRLVAGFKEIRSEGGDDEVRGA